MFLARLVLFSRAVRVKLRKINISFIMDSGPHWLLSFIDVGANVSDVGTKPNGNAKLFLHLCATGQFSISFLGRKWLKLLKQSRE